MTLFTRLAARLAFIAEQVEKTLGMEPLLELDRPD